MQNANLSVLFLTVMPAWGWFVIIASVAVALGCVIVFFLLKNANAKKLGSAKEQANKIVTAAEAEAERIKAQGREESKRTLKEALLEVKEQDLRLRN